MNKKSVEEKSKVEIARQVITPTRLYFVPGRGQIKAKRIEDVAKKSKQEEVGDANK